MVKNRIIIKCLKCGKSFEIKKSRENTAKYCSMACYDKHGENNPYWNKKHSQSIRNKMKLSWRNLVSNGYSPYNKQNLFNECLICGNKYKVVKSRLLETKFCSFRCKGIYISKNEMGECGRNWIDGRSYYPYPHIFNKSLKKNIKERDENKCVYCGSSVNLSIHHIDYDKNNNHTSNLITLCLRCNSSANSNRNFWLSYFHKIMEGVYAH